MTGKFLAAIIVLSALIAGAALYYLQVYAFYDEVEASPDAVQLTSLSSGLPEPLLHEGFKAIDSDSSPIRYRACFTTPISQPTLTETFELYDSAEPKVAPDWFDCFDAQALGAALASGEALAFMGTENIQYGIDRIVAVMPDGRGFAWHQINHCGEEVFDGNPTPADCPPKP